MLAWPNHPQAIQRQYSMKAVDLTKGYLVECTIHHRLDENKNVHLEHLEDLIFNDGLPGGQKAINYLVGFHEMLKGSAKTKFNLTTKWDGAPAVFVGTDPADGKFFVGTKSVFNKRNPLVNKSVEDIKANHEAEGLQEKLISAFAYLQKLNFKNKVVQGDLLFTDDSISEATIKGEEFIIFKPNTIIYAIPKNSKLASDMLRAKVGIVFHTEYVGGSELADLSAKFGFDAGSLGNNPDVWYRDAIIRDYSGQVTFTEDESQEMQQLITNANDNLKSVKNLDFLKNNDFGDDLRIRIKASVNKIIRELTGFEQDPKAFAQRFISEYKGTMKSAVKKLKNPDNQVKKTQTMLDGIKFLEDNQEQIEKAYIVYLDLIKAKEMIVSKLATVKQIDTFVQNAEGDYDVTGEEGFVAVDHIGNAIKLVDRLDFSVKNFGTGRPGA